MDCILVKQIFSRVVVVLVVAEEMKGDGIACSMLVKVTV